MTTKGCPIVTDDINIVEELPFDSLEHQDVVLLAVDVLLATAIASIGQKLAAAHRVLAVNKYVHAFRYPSSKNARLGVTFNGVVLLYAASSSLTAVGRSVHSVVLLLQWWRGEDLLRLEVAVDLHARALAVRKSRSNGRSFHHWCLNRLLLYGRLLNKRV